MRLGVVFDLRNPEPDRSHARLFDEALEFVEEADRLGLDVLVGEHHMWDDGYIPQPLTFLAAAAVRTRTARLGTSVLVAPLYHPLALAEQAAVVDCLSDGRLELGLGAGSRAVELEAFGVSPRERLRLFEERVELLRHLLAEVVRPGPIQAQIPLWAGLQGPRGSYLAGRLGLGMLSLPPAPWETYLRGLEDGDHDVPRLGGPVYAMLADDPERAVAALAPRIEQHWRGYDLHAVAGTSQPVPPPLDAATYRRIGPFAAPVDEAGTRRSIGFGVFTPAEAAAAIADIAAGRTVDWIYFPAALGSSFDGPAHRHLELIATELPRALERVLAPPSAQRVGSRR